MFREALFLASIALCFLQSEGAPSFDLRGGFEQWKQFRKVGDIWADCSSPNDHAKISNVIITPDPPVIGKNVTVSAHLTTDEEITGGSVKLTITFGFIEYKKTFDLCELTKKVDHPCPLPKGSVNVTVPTKIPSAAPQGEYKGHVVVSDQNGQELACVNLHFTLN